MRPSLLLFLLLLGLSFCHALMPAVTPPEEVDMDSAILDEMTKELQNLTDAKLIPGAIVMVSRKGKLVYTTKVGYERDDMMFRLFSMSKPIATAGVLLLVQDGLIGLDDPIGDYLPKLAHMNVIKGKNPRPNRFQTEPARSPITVRQLLDHTSGFVYGYLNTTVDALYRRTSLVQYISKRGTLDELIDQVAELPLLFHPGMHWWYSIGFDVAGAIIEKVSGMKLDDYLQKRIFEPLNMPDTGFYVPPEKIHRLAPYVLISGQYTATLPDQALLMNDYTKDPELKLAGMGLVASTLDYFRFATMLYNGGSLDGKRFLREDLVKEMMTNQLPDALIPIQMNGEYMPNLGFTLGSQIQLLEAQTAPKGEVQWGGQACTKYIISPSRETVIVAMTQKSPFPNQVAEIAKKWTYKAEKDLPPLVDSPDLLLLEPSPSMSMMDALPFFKNANPFYDDFSSASSSSAAEAEVQPAGVLGEGGAAANGKGGEEAAGGGVKEEIEIQWQGIGGQRKHLRQKQ